MLAVLWAARRGRGGARGQAGGRDAAARIRLDDWRPWLPNVVHEQLAVRGGRRGGDVRDLEAAQRERPGHNVRRARGPPELRLWLRRGRRGHEGLGHEGPGLLILCQGGPRRQRRKCLLSSGGGRDISGRIALEASSGGGAPPPAAWSRLRRERLELSEQHLILGLVPRGACSRNIVDRTLSATRGSQSAVDDPVEECLFVRR
mmetsp:Transcript_40016/g.99542  ORF Transcript_40016/g.99542 Transcript_40016/m.99542 type:complete len:203 (+) Transcript_40016:388-996(+)